jgi:hypothetical protein
MIFTPADLIAPIGTTLIAITFCVWAAFQAKQLPAKAISILTALAFIAGCIGWFVVRNSGMKPAYVTNAKMGVVPGALNKCEAKNVNEWEDWTISFWSRHYDIGCLYQAIPRVTMICKDQESMSRFSRLVRGYYNGMAIVVGYNGKLQYTESLYKHEMSHHLTNICGEGGSEKEHHALFVKVNLGY